MGTHPVNLAFRFLLAMAGLYVLARLGWRLGDGVFRYVLLAGIPLVAAAVWAVFAVPGDPGRSGKAVIAIPGSLRLLLELGFFGAVTWSLFEMRLDAWAWIYAICVLVHYAVSYDRIAWLLGKR